MSAETSTSSAAAGGGDSSLSDFLVGNNISKRNSRGDWGETTNHGGRLMSVVQLSRCRSVLKEILGRVCKMGKAVFPGGLFEEFWKMWWVTWETSSFELLCG